MKRNAALAGSLALLCTCTLARADAYDCFPLCPPPAEEPARVANLCEVGAVREAARINDRLKPVKELYGIAVNPTGFAVKMVDQHVVHIPKWVGYAMDPKGAAKAMVLERVRDAAKQQLGLENECRAAD